MKVLLVNTSERTGGAAVACNRLMRALRHGKVQARMLVRDRQTDQVSVVSVSKGWLDVVRFVWERLVIFAANGFRNKKQLFAVDIANTGVDITALRQFEEADIIHLHWVNQGMLSLDGIGKILRSGKPVVWTMHDMWAGTGICHYARKCDRYQSVCHNCQYLSGNGSEHDLSYKTFMRKKKTLEGQHIHFVGCSKWITAQVSRSALLAGHSFTSIPNPIDTKLFSPSFKERARKEFNLPLDRKLLLFGSMKITDERKGLKYLIESCKVLADKHPEIAKRWDVVVFGTASEQLASLVPFKVHSLGYVSKPERLAQMYNAADVYVTPSLEDNLPNPIMESMACGTPCVGFDIGGIPEMIDHMTNGYVARYEDAADLADGLHWVLEKCEYQRLRDCARKKVLDCYSESVVAAQYIVLYESLLEGKG